MPMTSSVKHVLLGSSYKQSPRILNRMSVHALVLEGRTNRSARVMVAINDDNKTIAEVPFALSSKQQPPSPTGRGLWIKCGGFSW